MDVSKRISNLINKLSKHSCTTLLLLCFILKYVKLDGGGSIDYAEHGANWNGTCATVLLSYNSS